MLPLVMDPGVEKFPDCSDATPSLTTFDNTSFKFDRVPFASNATPSLTDRARTLPDAEKFAADTELVVEK